LPKHQEDLGQTLGKWGVQSGPYVVLPVFGSSTLRDAAVVPVEFWADPWHYKEPGHVRYPGSALRAIDQRSTVLDASNLLEEAALDRYVFVRDAYMQRRQNKVYDGDPPSSAYEFDVGPTIAEDEAAPKTQAADGVATKAAVEPVEKPVVK
jgi:phospholipid-binding lipoprotein MlaA